MKEFGGVTFATADVQDRLDIEFFHYPRPEMRTPGTRIAAVDISPQMPIFHHGQFRHGVTPDWKGEEDRRRLITPKGQRDTTPTPLCISPQPRGGRYRGGKLGDRVILGKQTNHGGTEDTEKERKEKRIQGCLRIFAPLLCVSYLCVLYASVVRFSTNPGLVPKTETGSNICSCAPCPRQAPTGKSSDADLSIHGNGLAQNGGTRVCR